jgi:hypothetical protein
MAPIKAIPVANLTFCLCKMLPLQNDIPQNDIKIQKKKKDINSVLPQK